jgi:hypothetical protein
VGTPTDDDLRRAAEFLTTPLIIDILADLRGSESGTGCTDIATSEPSFEWAVALLTATGTVIRLPADADEPLRPRLALTPKGRYVCGLIDELLHAEAPQPATHPVDLSPRARPRNTRDRTDVRNVTSLRSVSGHIPTSYPE